MSRGDTVLLDVAVATVRQRWAMFAGSFVALGLGASIIAASVTTLAATSGVGHGKAQSVAQVTTAMSVLVVSFVLIGTFAFVVDQRARELALLSLLGITPRGIRRLIRMETVVVGGAAAAAGCLLGVPGAWLLRWWLVANDIASSAYPLGLHPGALGIAFLIGVAAALLGASSAAWRASRAQPLDALRESAASPRVMTPLRWLLGGVVLSGAATVALVMALVSPRNAASPGSFFEVPVLCAVGLALLAPALARPLTRLVTRPLVRRGVIATVVRQSTLNGGRRVAALVSPVVLAVGMYTGMLAMEDTGRAAGVDLLSATVDADVLALPATGNVFDDRAVTALRRVSEGHAALVAPERVTLAAGGERVLDTSAARAVPLAALGDVLTPGVVRGSLRGVPSDGIVVTEELAETYRLGVGDRLDARVGDASAVPVHIAAIVDSVIDDGEVYLPDTLPGTDAPTKALIRLDSGTTKAAGSADLQSHGVRLEPLATYLSDATRDEAESTRLANVVILGIAVVYALLAVANTLIMNVSARSRELAALSLAGATRRQVVGMLLAEALLTVAVGALVGVAGAAASQVLQRAALLRLVDALPATAPWSAAVAITSVCTATAAGAALLAAWRATRTTVVPPAVE